MITAIIFDIGGVFVKGTSKIFIKNVCELLGIEVKRDELEKELWTDLNRGNIPLEYFIRKNFEIAITDEEMKKLIQVWLNNWKLDSSMVKFAKKLKPKYKLIMLSNVDFDSAKKSEEIGLNFFDHKFRSFELGIVKPERKIYEHVLKKIKAKPEECVFIDDKIEDVEAAEKLGIHGIVFKDLKKLKKDLKKLEIEAVG
ncbi:MAG: HAD family phosphatase [Candidatus Aenigmarchaeota archaeon]|nr:HAD family phosphatase [Candidatus Aenigmarchaeota archaeon]